MKINLNGKRNQGDTAKASALYSISKMTTGGERGYFVEYAGDAIKNL